MYTVEAPMLQCSFLFYFILDSIRLFMSHYSLYHMCAFILNAHSITHMWRSEKNSSESVLYTCVFRNSNTGFRPINKPLYLLTCITGSYLFPLEKENIPYFEFIPIIFHRDFHLAPLGRESACNDHFYNPL